VLVQTRRATGGRVAARIVKLRHRRVIRDQVSGHHPVGDILDRAEELQRLVLPELEDVSELDEVVNMACLP
jgi:hypothetical protein